VFVPPGETYRVALSCYVRDADQSILGLKMLAGPDIASVGNATAQGAHPLITPSRTIRVIEAVQKPLVARNFALAAPTRNKDETFLQVAATVDLHKPSCSKVQFSARWRERLGDNSLQPRQAQISETPIPAADSVVRGFDAPPPIDTVPLPFRHEFGDTKHRNVIYTATVTSRYGEFFPEFAADPLKTCRVVDATELDVLSTAPPETVTIERIVPLCEWNEGRFPEGPGFWRKRTASMFRVYLKGPWYSSGDQEKLAVILGTAQAVDIDRLRPYVSLWGTDPVWNRDTSLSFLTRAALSGMDSMPAGNTYTVPGLGTPMEVVAFPVKFDHDANGPVIYSDIVISPNAGPYAPFAKLAFARFQLHSLKDVELSPVTMGDVMPLLPPRRVEYKWDHAGRNLTVALYGVTPADAPARARVALANSDQGPWEDSELARDNATQSWKTSAPIQTDPGTRVLVTEHEQYKGIDGQPAERLVFSDVIDVALQ
jgi:hypothetical protein